MADNIVPLGVAPASPQDRHRAEVATSIGEFFAGLQTEGPWDGVAVVAFRTGPDGRTAPFVRFHVETGFLSRCLPDYARSVLQSAIHEAAQP